MAKEAFYKLFVHNLRDIYSATHQIIDTWPELIDASSSPELKEAFDVTLEETRHQMRRLERIFSLLHESETDGIECEAMRGILQELHEVIDSNFPEAVKDAALIGAAQSVDHYLIARYGTVRTYAKELGLDECIDLLQASLDEEAATDEKLTELAEGGIFKTGINRKAKR